MDETIAAMCDRILRHHATLGRDLGTVLLPGASAMEIATATKGLPFHLPRSAVELYRWRSGTKRGVAPFGKMDFLPGWHLDEIEKIAKQYVELVEVLPDIWKKGTVPIFGSSGSDCLSIECRAKVADDGAIYCLREGLAMEIEFASLRTMLATYLEAFKEGVFPADSKGFLQPERTRFAAIARRLNPGVRRWTK